MGNGGKPLISVIMPAYNSQDTIEESLKSIRRQDYPKEAIEILVIDGGSSDATIDIAREYNARIIENPLKLPEAAKKIGLEKATGEWVCLLDTDEYLMSSDTLRRRMQAVSGKPQLAYIGTSGIRSRKDAKGIERYLNYFGDPFSHFVYYQYNTYDRIRDLTRHYSFEKTGDLSIFTIAGDDIPVLSDAKGDMFYMPVVRQLMEQNDTPDFAATLGDQVMRKTKCAAFLKGDYIVHDNRVTAQIYKRKIKWRIVNNLFGSRGGVGFSTRRSMNHKLLYRQILFVLYSVFFIFPLIDSVRYAVSYKDAYFLTHILWTEYTFIMIVFYLVCKVLHIPIKKRTQY